MGRKYFLIRGSSQLLPERRQQCFGFCLGWGRGSCQIALDRRIIIGFNLLKRFIKEVLE